ncbi:hypothetical protein BJX64DRAFT_285596 [Aspergillus heterothallicus]
MLEGSPHSHIPIGQFQQFEFMHMNTLEQIDQQLERELEHVEAYRLGEGQPREENEDEVESIEEGEILQDDPIPDHYQPQPRIQSPSQPYDTHQPVYDQSQPPSEIDDFTHHLISAVFETIDETQQQNTEEPSLPPPTRNIRRHNRHRRHNHRRRRHRARRNRHQDTRQQSPSSETQNSHSRAHNTIHPHPDFLPTLERLSRALHPLVSVTTGLPHPAFPKSILAYNMLTTHELNDLAIHFHQVYPPTRETFRYPLPVKPWVATNGFVRDLGFDIEVKRRRFGRFIGLKGCESPVEATGMLGFNMALDPQAEIRANVEREWEQARDVARWEQERGI